MCCLCFSSRTMMMTGSPQLRIACPAPYFEGTAVYEGEFKKTRLTDYKGKYLVLFFYPLDFTFVCPTEIIAFSDRADEFRSIDCEVVACSTDSHFCHLAWYVQTAFVANSMPLTFQLRKSKP